MIFVCGPSGLADHIEVVSDGSQSHVQECNLIRLIERENRNPAIHKLDGRLSYNLGVHQ